MELVGIALIILNFISISFSVLFFRFNYKKQDTSDLHKSELLFS